MMMGIGKARGLARLADSEGRFRMVALDQRPPLLNAIAKRRGIAPGEVSFTDMLLAKRLLVEHLAGLASAMLLDPNYAIPAAIDVLPPRCGCVLTLEDHRFEETPGGRKSYAIRDWSVEQIRRIGGDAVKVLAWYRPDAAPDVIVHQKRFVEEIGAECRRHDIPYVLELLVYPFSKSAAHTRDYVESPEKLPELVIESVRTFADPRYGVDLFKLESPLVAASLPPRDGSPAARRAEDSFGAIGSICREAGAPWVMLSAGASQQQFARVLDYSYAAGASGFLAGRTIWLDAILGHFPDEEAVAAALKREGVATLRALSELTAREAQAWVPSFPDTAQVMAEGDLTRLYAGSET